MSVSVDQAPEEASAHVAAAVLARLQCLRGEVSHKNVPFRWPALLFPVQGRSA